MKKRTKKRQLTIQFQAIILLLIVNVVLLALIFKPKIRQLFLTAEQKRQQEVLKANRERLFAEINPSKGYELTVSYGDLGPKMIRMGVIDLEKFTEVYSSNNQPLDVEQLVILTDGSNQKIKITRENSYFLLNFFWAVGLGNKSKVLSEGEMVRYEGGAGNFASTGGWSLAKSDSMDYYSAGDLIPLTEEQEDLVWEVASNIYRPCCGNSTAFPDCNHGMALLGMLELMAANGASEKDMYEAAKYFNAYWFPSNYYDLALYFKNKEGKNFKDIDAKTVLGKDYSSATGYSKTKNWLSDNGIIEEPPAEGGSCGV